MKRLIHREDLEVFSELDMVYNKVRVFQAKHNETEFRCQNSGKCCKVGLKIHLAEAAHIAFSLRQEYYLIMEDKGEKAAEKWMDSKIEKLMNRMHDDSWDSNEQTTDNYCAFWDDGCTIYGYRPLVCRAYGTITEVDEFCARKRNDYNTIEHYAGEAVEVTVQDFQRALKKYGENHGDNYIYDVVVYMPLGVLSFILDPEELEELYNSTRESMWQGMHGWFNYQSRFTHLHGFNQEYILEEAKKRGFEPEDLEDENKFIQEKI